MKREDNSIDVFLIMGDEGIERMRGYDPAEFEPIKLGHPWNTMKIKCVTLMYATKEEEEAILKCKTGKEVAECLRHQARGWKYRPDLGDHDGPYTGVKTETN